MLTITDKEFIQLSEYIKANYGINLSDKKKALVVGRLQNILMEKSFESFSQYIEYVMKDKTGEAVKTLISKITTNHTYFMRESEHFQYFKNVALKYWYEKLKNSKDLRIWSAGCSSGEEPYTLAMIIADFFGNEKSLWDTKILATDISSRVLSEAQNGVYSNESLEAVPKIWRNQYFQRFDNQNSIVVDSIKNEVIFRTFNLMNTTLPFKKKFHVIFCRNVMIYFDSETKRELINRFYEQTEYGGYLFIGHSESLNREETKFKYIMPAVYRKE
ncbi:CheR family methyltransferase [Acetivibrio cellulolyticus]|uniref:CheR family methyltransferase n=1 Tax=Acetivibrio cellulolyticus TaxID=35830 RepID=UPI0001E2D47E|nr:protein-glutamate O-methyltransferase CheR [Acetivibrio cellulolyticus]